MRLNGYKADVVKRRKCLRRDGMSQVQFTPALTEDADELRGRIEQKTVYVRTAEGTELITETVFATETQVFRDDYLWLDGADDTDAEAGQAVKGVARARRKNGRGGHFEVKL